MVSLLGHGEPALWFVSSPGGAYHCPPAPLLQVLALGGSVAPTEVFNMSQLLPPVPSTHTFSPPCPPLQVLALGGSVAPAEVFKLFRGREPSTAALLRHNDLLPAGAA